MSHETIKNCRLFRYTLPFRYPLKFASKTLLERKGLLFQIEWNTGATGIGEIAPLPGYSKESLRDILQLMPNIMRQLPGQNIFELLFGDRTHSLFNGLPPSLIFGIESALLSTPAAKYRNPLFIGQETVELSINGLLNFRQRFDQNDAEIATRFDVVKIKLPMHDITEILTYLKRIRVQNPNLKMLIDANQSWKLDSLLELGIGLKELDIEWIEEPFSNLSDAETFYSKTGIFYAVDEHWIQNPSDIIKKVESKQLPGLKAVIIKPTLYGSILELEQMASRLAFHGIQMIISSSFESGIGISTLSRLAYNLSPGSFAGLDTIRMFKSDVLNPPLHLAANSITVYPLVSQPYSLLEAYYAPINQKVLEQFASSQ